MSWSVDEQQVHKHLYVGSKTSVSIGGPIDALRLALEVWAARVKQANTPAGAICAFA